MQLRRGFLFGMTAAIVFAQDFPLIDKAEMDKAMSEVQAEVLKQKDLLADVSSEMLLAKSMAMDKMKQAHDLMLTHKGLFAEMPEALFGMQKGFLQGSVRGGGGPLSEDEELKIMAIDGLMQNDPERAIPIVDKLLQNQQASIRLRVRALQSLGNSSSAKAREVVVRVAKDGS